MKLKKALISLAFSLLGLGGLYAQESPTTTGGEAIGTGGTASYSIGQMAYTTHTGTNGSLAQGVQQPYEISTIVGINETNISLGLSVYPNPATNYLKLKVEKTEGIVFQLFDIQGKVIQNKRVNSNVTKICLDKEPVATYFLKVIKDNQIIKVFKIIKTQ